MVQLPQAEKSQVETFMYHEGRQRRQFGAARFKDEFESWSLAQLDYYRDLDIRHPDQRCLEGNILGIWEVVRRQKKEAAHELEQRTQFADSFALGSETLSWAKWAVIIAVATLLLSSILQINAMR